MIVFIQIDVYILNNNQEIIMSDVTIPVLPEKFLNRPAEKVVDLLMANPNECLELFERTIFNFIAANYNLPANTPAMQELLTMLIGSLQLNAQLEGENSKLAEDLADYVTDGFPIPSVPNPKNDD